ncbi:hypothetical protein VX037_08785 [Gordonia sp. Z-3]|uniref:hypothetical protein n=1 Tax=unclassified Gordonia (in: high G+C Gram-positive bacteria) TaxID=2657482 RepID=UPI00257E0A2A|nr:MULTISPECIES: hypothetical protein [unclassified Gordonia (in: high G+C Gram-positive bacteria)]MED5801116.1 hypothetical protein [Gordonia sp. Z-3]
MTCAGADPDDVTGAVGGRSQGADTGVFAEASPSASALLRGAPGSEFGREVSSEVTVPNYRFRVAAVRSVTVQTPIGAAGGPAGTLVRTAM